MIDWVTAILPCNHSGAISGGRIAWISPEGEIEWPVEKKQQVFGSHEFNISIKSNGATRNAARGGLTFAMSGARQRPRWHGVRLDRVVSRQCPGDDGCVPDS